MQLKSLIIEKFRKFSSQKVEFTPGINVVIGNNEAGKSTLSRALLEVLFENPSTSKKERKLNTSWMHDGDMKLQLEYEHGQEQFHLLKNFSTGASELKNIETHAKFEDYQDVEAKLLEQLALPSRAVYESTAFIHQSDITAIHSSKKTDRNEFIAAIQRMAVAGGADVNVKQIITELEKSLSKMQIGLKGVAKHPGPIKATEEAIAKLQEKLTEMRQQYLQITDAETIYQDSQTEISKLKQQAQQQNKLLEANRTYLEAKKAHDQLSEKLESISKKIEQVEVLTKDLEQLNADLQEEFSLFINENVEELHEFAISLRGDLEKSEKLQLKKEQLSKQSPAVAARAFKPAYYLVGALATVVAGAGGWLVWNQLLVAIVGGIIALAFTSLFFLKQKQRSQTNELEQASHSQITQLEQEVDEIHSAKTSFLEELGLQKLDDFFAKYKEYQKLKVKLRDKQIQLKTILQDNELEELKTERRKLLLEQDKLETTKLTEEIVNSKLDGQAYHKLQDEYERNLAQLQKLEREYTSAEVRLEQAVVSQDQIYNTENELEQLQQQYQRYLHRAQVIELTIELMKKATADIAASAGAMIAGKISENLPRITKGRYHKARVTKMLEIEVYSEEKQDWLSPDGNLSRGTVDQIYLLARLAFVEVLVGENTIPLILDDPLVTFDADRLAVTKDILQELARSKQVILLTYDMKYQDWGHVIKLDSL